MSVPEDKSGVLETEDDRTRPDSGMDRREFVCFAGMAASVAILVPLGAMPVSDAEVLDRGGRRAGAGDLCGSNGPGVEQSTYVGRGSALVHGCVGRSRLACCPGRNAAFRP